MVESCRSCGTETSIMRRQIGAWAAPIASSSAGLLFQVAIVEGYCIAFSRCRGKLSTLGSPFGSPRAEQKRTGDQAAERHHADGDGGEHARQSPAQDFDSDPAASRGDDKADETGDERRYHAASALAGEGERHAQREQTVEWRYPRD